MKDMKGNLQDQLQELIKNKAPEKLIKAVREKLKYVDKPVQK